MSLAVKSITGAFPGCRVSGASARDCACLFLGVGPLLALAVEVQVTPFTAGLSIVTFVFSLCSRFLRRTVSSCESESVRRTCIREGI